MIEFAGVYINPYLISHIEVEHTIDDVGVNITVGCAKVFTERYKSKAEALDVIRDISDLIDPSLAFADMDDDDEEDEEEDEDQFYKW